MHSVWFVLGISGTGKSYFSQRAAQALSWFHYEIDQLPHDGITHWGFRTEWDAYLQHYEIEPLVRELKRRSCRSGCTGSILSFPGNLLTFLTEKHIDSAKSAVEFIVLSGPADVCRSGFLQREAETERGLPLSHWENNNVNLYRALERPWIAPYVFNPFLADGSRMSVAEMLAQLRGVDSISASINVLGTEFAR